MADSVVTINGDGEDDGLRVAVRWHVNDAVISRYATNLVVQRTENEYTLNFFEVQIPLIVGSEEEQREQSKEIGRVDAVCVGRIIVAAKRLPDFARIIQSLLPPAEVGNDKESEG